MNLIPLTLDELKIKLASSCDEVSLLEVLQINSYDLVEAFSEKIEENYERLLIEVMSQEEMEDDGKE